MRKFLVPILVCTILGCAAIHERNEVLHVVSGGTGALTNAQMHGGLVGDQVKKEAKESSSRPEIQPSSPDKSWGYLVSKDTIEWYTNVENNFDSAREMTASIVVTSQNGTKASGDSLPVIVGPREKSKASGSIKTPKGLFEDWKNGNGGAKITTSERGPVFNAEDFGSGSDTVRLSQVKAGVLKWAVPVFVAKRTIKVTYTDESGKKSETTLPTSDVVKVKVTISFQDREKKEVATDTMTVDVKAGEGTVIGKELSVPDDKIVKMCHFVVKTEPL